MRKFKNWTTNEKHLALAGMLFFTTAVCASIGWVSATTSQSVAGTESAPSAGPDMATVATIASAIATILLAVFAIAAWRLQGKNLEKMEEQIRTQENRVIEERQQAYLADYMLALKKMANSANEEDVDTVALRDRTTDTLMLWTMDMLRNHKEMRKLTKEINYMLGDQAEELGLDFSLARDMPGATKSECIAKGNEVSRLTALNYRQYRPSVDGYLVSLQEWQMNVERRAEIFDNLTKKFNISPNLDDNFNVIKAEAISN